MSIKIRKAERADAPLIFDFIYGLAVYEKLEDEMVTSVAELEENIFDKGFAEVLIGEYEGKPAGFALFFHNFSTFLGKPGIFLEDLFVKPEFRGKGVGKMLITAVGELAVERNCGRFEWFCLDWNQPSIEFYESLGARPQKEWVPFRLSGRALEQMGKV
ncbi:GNAT family N-acetyltransferase [Persicobacter sp. CCB-QB2]|uniref:GNAT family N-acetyltransferase n=1 Tax=Persicobacter sp. CCB-QB2 TaxID=1561025 RepID=UPI0006A96507|nr:GNAT family N-acetyltransferase [Persicobacter sp. CCB-QB2]